MAVQAVRLTGHRCDMQPCHKASLHWRLPTDARAGTAEAGEDFQPAEAGGGGALRAAGRLRNLKEERRCPGRYSASVPHLHC